jgi:hypothetical protein
MSEAPAGLRYKSACHLRLTSGVDDYVAAESGSYAGATASADELCPGKGWLDGSAGRGHVHARVGEVDTGIARLHASRASRTAKETAERLRTWLTTLPPADTVIHADLHLWNMCCGDANKN